MNFKLFFLKKIKRAIEGINILGEESIIDPEAEVIGSEINGKVIISEGCKVFKCNISGNVKVERFTSLWGPNVHINSNIHPITIGSFCSIASNSTIIEYNHSYSKLSSYFVNKNIYHKNITDDITSNGGIEIGHDVWIGTGAIVLSGVTIGNGAVIGANSVVTKNLPSYAIVGGVPAKILKYRFQKDLIEKLEGLKWWDWDIKTIETNIQLFNCQLSSELLLSLLK
jgi:virginiamycin A acetyltransferase